MILFFDPIPAVFHKLADRLVLINVHMCVIIMRSSLHRDSHELLYLLEDLIIRFFMVWIKILRREKSWEYLVLQSVSLQNLKHLVLCNEISEVSAKERSVY